jgi:hypothetical protein
LSTKPNPSRAKRTAAAVRLIGSGAFPRLRRIRQSNQAVDRSWPRKEGSPTQIVTDDHIRRGGKSMEVAIGGLRLRRSQIRGMNGLHGGI